MAFQNEDCPSCFELSQLPEGYVDEIVQIKRQSGTNIAADHIYEKRLAVCAACEYCHAGIMCRMCGCFVQFRALGIYNACPNPYGNLWKTKEDRHEAVI